MSVRAAAVWSLAATYVGFVVQFAVSVLISRYFLSPAEVGIYSVALSAAMLVAVLQDFGITRWISGQADLTDAQVRTCFTISVIFALAIGLVVAALAWPLARIYDEPTLFTLLLVIAGSYLIVPFGIVPNALLTRAMKFRSLFVVNTGAGITNGAVALALAANGYSALSLAWALVAQALVRAMLGNWLSKARLPFPPSLADARPILNFGSASSVLFISGALGTRTPELIIGRLLGLTAVGLYGRAASLALQLHSLMAGAVGQVFYPAFRRLRDSGAELDRPYLRLVAAYSGVVWPAMAMLAVAAEPLVLVLYGEKWAGVAGPLRWVALAEILFVALPLHVELPILLGRIGTLIRYNLFDTAVSIGLLTAAAFYGLEWAAASRLGYGVVWYLIYAAFMRQLVGFDWRSMAVAYARSGAGALAAVAPLLAAYQLWSEPDAMTFGQLATCCLAGVLCWGAALIAVRHPLVAEALDVARPRLPRLVARLAPHFR